LPAALFTSSEKHAPEVTDMDQQKVSSAVRLSEEQQSEGYWVEELGDRVLVWHHNAQIALLCSSPDIERKVQEVVERRRKQLREVEEKTGWRPG
jgi:hypothetical protein